MVRNISIVFREPLVVRAHQPPAYPSGGGSKEIKKIIFMDYNYEVKFCKINKANCVIFSNCAQNRFARSKGGIA